MNKKEEYIHQPRLTINQEIKIKNNNNKNNFMILLNSNDISHYQIYQLCYIYLFTIHFFITLICLNKK
jgi:hypothetical protein